jgi:integral membrane protein
VGAEPTGTPRVARAVFRVVAVVEALTWAGLLAGMAVKYLGSGDETGVHVMGPLHGAAFVAYCVVALWTARVFRWSWTLVLAGLASSVPPFGTWLFEQWARRRGHLDVTGPQPAPAGAPQSHRHGAAPSPPR